MKHGENVLFVFSALLVLAWPLFAFTSIFAFDAPIQSGFDEARRYAFVLAVLSYPFGFFRAIYLKARDRLPQKEIHRALLLASPWLHLVFVFASVAFLELLFSR